MKISKRAACIQPSLTRKLFNMASQYDDVIDLTLGDPDLPSPPEIADAAYRAMTENKMHYSANAGLYETRAAIARRVEDTWHIPCDPDKNIIVTVGGMEALYLSFLSMIDSGDEVIVLAPYYVNYVQMIELSGGTPVIVNAYSSEKGLCANKEAIERAVTEKTAAIVVNSPNNPTGDVLSGDDLKIISDIAEKYDFAIISDEVYRTLLYDGREHESILQYESARGRTVLADSMSKEYSMTGWRIGYACGPEQIISQMVKLQENVAACANISSQYALTEAYTKKLEAPYIREAFQKRRDYLYNELVKFPSLRPIKPKGTFYMFVDIKGTGMDSESFAYELLKKAHIAVVPGIAYGAMYDGYIRIALTKDIDILKETVRRLREVL